MKFDMSQPLVGYNGETIKTSEQDDSPVTFGATLAMACVNANPQKHQDGDSKLKIYRILQKVGSKDAGEIELESQEVSLLKSLVGDMYGVVVVGAVYDMLEKTAEH